MGNRIDIPRGTSMVLRIKLTDANKQPYVLQEGERLLFGVKQHFHTRHLIFKEFQSTADGYTIELLPQDTNRLEPAYYSYDVSLESGQDFYKPIHNEVFRVMEAVTKWGEEE